MEKPGEEHSEDIPPAGTPSPIEQPEVPIEGEDPESDKDLEHMDDEEDDDDEEEEDMDDEKEAEEGIAPPSPGMISYIFATNSRFNSVLIAKSIYRGYCTAMRRYKFYL